MITLGEFLSQCDSASWMMVVRVGDDPTNNIIASGVCTKPHCTKERIHLNNMELPTGLIGTLVEEGRNAGTLTNSVLVEDCAVFVQGNATLTVWCITNKEKNNG